MMSFHRQLFYLTKSSTQEAYSYGKDSICISLKIDEYNLLSKKDIKKYHRYWTSKGWEVSMIQHPEICRVRIFLNKEMIKQKYDLSNIWGVK